MARSEIKTADLIAQYLSGMSLERIAKTVPLTCGGVRVRLIKAGIKLRPRNHGIYRRGNSGIATSLIIEKYLSGMSAHAVGIDVGLTAKTVIDRLSRAGIERRTRSDYHGNVAHDNPNWKGGRFRLPDTGYVRVRVGVGQYEFEHRVIASQKIGRKLNTGEIVHHMNGVRDDNRPENLSVTTRPEHEVGTYVKCLQARIRQLEDKVHSLTCRAVTSGMTPYA